MAPHHDDFRRLHAPAADGRPLVLPSAWDLPSALALVEAGFPAVATSSFALAVTHGRPDGRRASRDATLSLVLDLAHGPVPLPVPVSVDVEDGYSDNPAEVAAYVSLLNVAGVDLADSSGDRLVEPVLHAAKIGAVKHRTAAVFVAARVDVLLLDAGADLDEVVARARAYVAAGADAVLVPGVTDLAVLRRLAAEVDAPLACLPVPGATLAELAETGVRRVGTGSAPYRAAHHAALATALAVRDDLAPPPTTPWGEVQRSLLSRS